MKLQESERERERQRDPVKNHGSFQSPSLPDTLLVRIGVNEPTFTSPEVRPFRGSFHTDPHVKGMTGGFWKTRDSLYNLFVDGLSRNRGHNDNHQEFT